MAADPVTEIVRRSCPTCEASCGLVLEVDRAAGKVRSIKGDPDDPRSRGYVCAKSQAFNYVHEDPERLRQPVMRTAGGWEAIDWQQAFELVGSRLRQIREKSGKDSIAIYWGNPNGHNMGTMLYTQLFMQMMGSERFFSAGTVDQQPKQVSSNLLYGNDWFWPIPDIDHTDFFVCMGGNPAVSQGSIMSAPDFGRRIDALRARGGKSVVIDPRRTESAELADQHIFIRPGTDAFFLLAFVNVLFAEDLVKLRHLDGIVEGVDAMREQAEPFTPEAVAAVTGVDPGALRTLVREFCAADSAVVYGRIGLCTQRFGTLSSWLVDVVDILTGNLDRRGGAMFPRQATGQSEPSDAVGQLSYDNYRSRVSGFPEICGQLPASLLGEELEATGDDRIRAMITVAGNPVLTVPNGKRIREGLEKLDFMVSFDIYINETTCCADVILPPVTQLEHSNYDFLFQGTAVRNFARYSPRVFEPPAGGLEQWQIMLGVLAGVHGMTIDGLDDLMVDGLAAQAVEWVNGDNPGLTAEMVKQAMGGERGPERLLDAMLRAGPYGDKFVAGREGLSLATVRAADGCIDLGPLQPSLPALLRTEGKKIRLVHDYLAGDLARLHQALKEGLYAPDRLLLIGRRQIRDMNSWLHNLTNYVRGKNRCTLLVHPDDAARVGIADGAEVRIRSRVGEVVAPVEISDEVMPGVVSLPHGWGHRHAGARQSVATSVQPGVSCNDLVDDTVLDLPSGTSVVNGVEVEVLPLA